MSLLLLLLLNFLAVLSFDPSDIDFCKLRCKATNTVSSGCSCSPKVDGREEVLGDLDIFRQAILDTHNMLRNKIARGDEEARGYPKAADMTALNYDFELEHIVRCYLMANFSRGRDSCRMTSYCKDQSGPGSNAAGNFEKITGGKEAAEYATNGWYREIDWIEEEDRKSLITKYRKNVKYKEEAWEYTSSHFTQLVWSTMTRIGCARMWNPKFEQENLKMIIYCNYAGPDEKCSANEMNLPVYSVGKPCSKCGKTKCNKQLGGRYDALCGDVRPIKKYKLTSLDRISEQESVEEYENSTITDDKTNKTPFNDIKSDAIIKSDITLLLFPCIIVNLM